MKVGIFCRPHAAEPDVMKQQRRLQAHIAAQGWELEHAYIDDSDGTFDPQNSVQLAMLQAAKRNELDQLLVTDQRVFPAVPTEHLPPIMLYIMNEQRTVSIGTPTADVPAVPVEPAHKVSIYTPNRPILY